MSSDGPGTPAAPLEPLNPLSDWDRANWARVHFDPDGLGWQIKEQARRRAPNEHSRWRHQVGFAGEVAASTICGVSANWEILPPGEGDGGFDFVCDGQRVEVKTTTDVNNPELEVSTDRTGDADKFVLAVCEDPRRWVYVPGTISRADLKTYGHKLGDRVIVGLDRLRPCRPRAVYPDTVRDIQDPCGTLDLKAAE